MNLIFIKLNIIFHKKENNHYKGYSLHLSKTLLPIALLPEK